MAFQKLPPRQKMINVLYFVLLAILALNVSSEVLDAFKVVNDGINTSNSSLQSKNSGTYFNLTSQFKNDSLKAKEAYEKSILARQLSSHLYDLLEQYKMQMIAEAGGVDTSTGKIRHDDDIDIATRMFVENGGKKGRELKTEIEATRQKLLALLHEPLRTGVSQSLSLKAEQNEGAKSWEYAKFNHVPVVAAVTILSKYQNDLLGAESHIIGELYNSINANIKNVDRMQAKIISPSSFILQGESYKADVMVAAYSSTVKPEVFLGQFNSMVKKDEDGNYPPLLSLSDVPPLVNPQKVEVQGGFGKIQMAATATGSRKYTGVVRVKGKGDGYEFYPFEGEYQVAPKVAVVAPTKMNILYIGLDNPIDISVPGVAQTDVSAVFEGDGSLVRNPNGNYYAHVTTKGQTKIKVSAKVDGKMMPVGEQQFRVKRIPNPVTTVDGLPYTSKATGTYMKQRSGVVPKSDDFPYGDLPWKVQSFVVSVRKGTDIFPVENSGPVFNQKIKELFKGLKKGDAVFIDNILVKGPDNVVRPIAPIAFDITSQ